MAEPTLKGVLAAIAKMATKSDLDQLDRKVDGLRTELATRLDRVDEQLTDLDRDLTKHMDVHREIAKDIEGLKRRPARTATDRGEGTATTADAVPHLEVHRSSRRSA